MKILYIVDHITHKSGIASVVLNYYRHINPTIIQIDFITLDENDGDLEDELVNSGAKIYYMPKLSMKTVQTVKKYFVDFFDNYRCEYTIVHSHFSQMDGLIFPIAKRNGFVRCCISHSHNSKFADDLVRAVRNRILCLPIKRLADVKAACSIKAGENLYGRKFSKLNNSIVINNAIDTNRFSYDEKKRFEYRNKLQVDSSTLVLGTVGGIRLQKNQKFLLDIAKCLKEKNPELKFKMFIIGEGPMKCEIAEYIRVHNLSGVIELLGERNNISELYQAMDIFLLPSLYEGLPVVGVEAQSVGLKCIFSANITNEINIVNSTFLEIDDVRKWVDMIKTIAWVPTDRISAKQKVIESGFDITVESRKLEQFYVEVGNNE